MSSRVRWLGRKAVAALVTIFVAASMNFFLFHAAPGNAASLGRLPGASQAARAAITKEFGLDKPLFEQYLSYLNQLLHGNMGLSVQNYQPVISNLRAALFNTIPLVLTGTIFAIIIGTLTGLLSAWRRGGLLDHSLLGSALVLYALPAQWLGLMILALNRGWLPVGGMTNPFAPATGAGHYEDILRHLILPSFAYGLTLYGQYTLIVRSSLMETLGEDYILTARAKGLGNFEVIRKHAFRNAMLPVTTVFALSLGSMVAGSILIETVFSWPGIGRAVYQAVLSRDYPMLEGAFLMLTVSVVLCNLIADALYTVIDPRVTVS